MSFPIPFVRLISKAFPYFKNSGIDYVAAAGRGDEGIQSGKVTLTADPTTVTFASLGLKDMAGADYSVVIGGEISLATVKVKESTRATTSFQIVGGTGAEVCYFIVAGRLAGQGSSSTA